MNEFPNDENDKSFRPDFEINFDLPDVPKEDEAPDLSENLKTLQGTEASEAKSVIESLDHSVVHSAEKLFNGFSGEQILHVGETVITPSGQAELMRDAPFRSNRYTLNDGDSNTFAVDEETGLLSGPGIDELEANKTSILRGELEGTHTISATKSLATEIGGPEVNLMIEVTRTSEGTGAFPTTTVDLALVRNPDYIDRIAQSFHIESDPNTNTIKAGSSLDASTFVNISGENSNQPYTEYNSTANPVPELTAESLQQLFDPRLPLDRPLNEYEWRELIDLPLNPADLLKED